MGRLSVSLGDWILKNPLIPASGCFGYGWEFEDFFDVNLCGTYCMKGTTLQERKGNPLPRIAEYAGGMLNAVGLENPGIDKVIAEYMPNIRFQDKVIANISGFSIEEYVEVARRFDQQEKVGILELNVSCPNVKHGGMSFGMDVELCCQLLKEVKKVVKKPVYVKCTPQCPDLAAMVCALEKAGADGLVLLNTWLGMRLDEKDGKPILANGTGGVSGEGIFPLTVYRLYQLRPLVSIPIIACGGISSARDVIEVLSAGANAVELGTVLLKNPLALPQILCELEAWCSERGIENISEIIGRAFR